MRYPDREIPLKDWVIAKEVIEGSVRPCDECGRFVPFDNPDAEIRVCNRCIIEMSYDYYTEQEESYE
jgi:DNA-directed RNA polymerase subunit E'/Rpb7